MRLCLVVGTRDRDAANGVVIIYCIYRDRDVANGVFIIYCIYRDRDAANGVVIIYCIYRIDRDAANGVVIIYCIYRIAGKTSHNCSAVVFLATKNDNPTPATFRYV